MTVRLGLCALALTLTSAGAASGGDPARPPAVLVLRADNVLLLVQGRHVKRIAAFGRARSSLQLARGSLIRLIGRRAAVLVPHAKPAADEIVLVDLASMHVDRRVAMRAGITFRALVFDKARRELILAGNRAHDHAVMVARMGLLDSSMRDVRVVRASARGAFRVSSVAVAGNGAFAVVAYHGTNTTGADVFGLPDWRRCPAHEPLSGCLEIAHGEAVVVRGLTFATTGTPPAVAVFRGRREIAQVGLEPSAHVTAIAVEPSARVAWVPGACDAPRGVWRIDLGKRRATRYFGGLPTLRVPVAPCGYTLELSRDSRWAVTTETALPVPDAERSGAIWTFGISAVRRPPIQVPIAVDPVAAAFVG
jgi:hypothetical protein